MTLNNIFETDEKQKLTQFNNEEIKWLESKIQTRKDGKYSIECIIRGKNDNGDYFELTPEECVRQLLTKRLIEKYDYKKEQIAFEVPVTFAGKEKITDEKRIDIAIFETEKKKDYRLIIEVKRPNIENENEAKNDETSPRQQLDSYCSQKKAKVGVIANGGNLLKFYAFPDFENALDLQEFPYKSDNLDDWKNNQRFTLKQLMLKDRLNKELLRDIIENVNQKFSSSENPENAFDEIFKLIFCKLYDEYLSRKDADKIATRINEDGKKLAEIDDSNFRTLDFCAKGSNKEVKAKLDKLFENAQNKWKGIFTITDSDGKSKNASFNMASTTIQKCVKELENVKLFNSNLEVVDDAFEHLVNPNQKSEMGQFFTPRYVIDMCVKMVNPNQKEKIIDTAAGSCGFPMHAIFHVWQKMNPKNYNFTSGERSDEELNFVQNNVFGIDYSAKSVRVGRMLNIIAGDGHTNILELNTLDYDTWENKENNADWKSKNYEGFEKLKNLATNGKSYKNFNFDIVMANPPFSDDDNKNKKEEDKHIYKNYELSKDKAVGREVLFIERNLDFLKAGGRMAIVLPQGIFNNSTLLYVRSFIADKARILAVVGLHGNVFKNKKNGTGTKTSVLFVQKWTDENTECENICPKTYIKAKDENGNVIKNEDGSEKEVLDYPIFFATMQEPSKDNSGDKIYVKEDYLSWTNYTWENVKKITRKSDKKEITQAEYDEAKKKSDYKVEIVKHCFATEHQNQNPTNDFLKSTVFIKDLFEKDNSTIESHKKWQQRKINFVLKTTKDKDKTKGKKEILTLKEYLQLSKAQKDFYVETLIEGKNDNTIITNAVYSNLSKEEKKFYDKAEWINEWSERIKDTHGHYFVKHDLFNHDPELNKRATAFDSRLKDRYCKDGIADLFELFSYAQGFSFSYSKEELCQKWECSEEKLEEMTRPFL